MLNVLPAAMWLSARATPVTLATLKLHASHVSIVGHQGVNSIDQLKFQLRFPLRVAIVLWVWDVEVAKLN